MGITTDHGMITYPYITLYNCPASNSAVVFDTNSSTNAGVTLNASS